MVGSFRVFSSLLGKLKKPATPDSLEHEAGAAHVEGHREPASPEVDEAQLLALGDAELREEISRHSERRIVALLSTLADPGLKQRVIHGLSDESALKRIARSQALDKKLRRVAESRLRETGTQGMKLRLEKISRLNDRMQSFFQSPDWTEGAGLLAEVSAPGLDEDHGERGSSLISNFKGLRGRLAREMEAFGRAEAEMEDICLKLETSEVLPKAAEIRLQSRWRELGEKFAFLKEGPLAERHAVAIATRREFLAASASPGPAPYPMSQTQPADTRSTADSPSAAPHATGPSPKAAARQKKAKLEQERRLALVAAIRMRIEEVSRNLAERRAGPELRKLRSEAAALKNYRREFPAELDEVEALLTRLLKAHAEAFDEARWDSWAKTDLALRIQKNLEEVIGALESEADPEIILRGAPGLTGQLHEYAGEMRSFGSLERSKDHEIWKQFKLLSDRGWSVCERARGIAFEQLKAWASEHAVKAVDFTVSAVSDPRRPVAFKEASLEPELFDRISSLRKAWLAIGAKASSATREQETIFTKLYEAYVRQRNLQLGRIKRTEDSALQLRQGLLREMKITSEIKATLTSRAKTARNLLERWEKSAAPSGTNEMEGEFETLKVGIATEIQAELQRFVTELSQLVARAQATLAQIQAKSGLAAEFLRQISGLEAELKNFEYQRTQFRGLELGVADASSQAEYERRFQEERARVIQAIQMCKEAATAEARARAEERWLALLEAESLPMKGASGLPRLEELKKIWKNARPADQKGESPQDYLFNSVCVFCENRLSRSSDSNPSGDLPGSNLKEEKELLYSLEALLKLRKPGKGAAEPLLPLPFPAEELRREAPGKLLEAGMKYRHVLSMDPDGGIVKEAKKIMERWNKRARVSVQDDESLKAFWKCYLERIHLILGIAPA